MKESNDLIFKDYPKRCFEDTKGCKPTLKQWKGFLFERELHKNTIEFEKETNPLNNIGEWISHIGKGVDAVYYVNDYKIGVEIKDINGYLSKSFVDECVFPRFKTNKHGKRLHLDFKTLVVNPEMKVSEDVRNYIERHGVRIMTILELKGFLNALKELWCSYSVRISKVKSITASLSKGNSTIVSKVNGTIALLSGSKGITAFKLSKENEGLNVTGLVRRMISLITRCRNFLLGRTS